MTEQEFHERPSNMFMFGGLIYELYSESYNPVTRTILASLEHAVVPISLSRVTKFLSKDENPEYFL
jgi:hypothetical protein